MAETIGYRSNVVAQSGSWFFGQILARATSSRSSQRVVSGRRVIHPSVSSRLEWCTSSVEAERTLCRLRSGRAGGYGRAAGT